MRRLEAALNNGLRLVQLREKDYSREALRALALKMLPLLRQHDARLIINADIELAKEIGADGVQLTGAQLAELRERPDVDWCAASCHNAEELRRAEAAGLRFRVAEPGAGYAVASGCAASGLGKFCGDRGGVIDPGVCAGRFDSC